MFSNPVDLFKPKSFKHWFILNIIVYGIRKGLLVAAEGSTSVGEYNGYILALLASVALYVFYSFHYSRALFERKNNFGGYVIIFLIAISVLLNIPLFGALFTTPIN